MIRCVVSKEMVVGDRNAVEILSLMRAGYRVTFVGGEEPKPKVQRIRRQRRRAPNVTPEQLRQMVELRKKGLAHRIIARRFNMSLSGSSNAIRKAVKGGAK